MAEPYTTTLAYSGPLAVYPRITPVSIDIFGVTDVRISKPPVIAIQSGTPASAKLKVTATDVEWTAAANLPAGLYYATYLGGAINAYAAPPPMSWNETFVGQCSVGRDGVPPTNGVWLRTGSREIPISRPAFGYPGGPDAGWAEQVAVGARQLISHGGGPLFAVYDADDTVGPGSGYVEIGLETAPLSRGGWTVAWSSAGHPRIHPEDVESVTPRVLDLSPGVHHLQYITRTITQRTVWQDYWLWVWQTPVRRGAASYVEFTDTSRDVLRSRRVTMFAATAGEERLPWDIFPVRPPKAPGNKVGTPLLDRRYYEQLPPISGNTAERPQTLGNLPKGPEQRGSTEAF